MKELRIAIERTYSTVMNSEDPAGHALAALASSFWHINNMEENIAPDDAFDVASECAEIISEQARRYANALSLDPNTMLIDSFDLFKSMAEDADETGEAGTLSLAVALLAVDPLAADAE